MRTNVKKIVSLLLALLFMLSMGAASLAETITNAVTDSVAERKLLALIDSTWAELDAVEEQLFASKATEEDTIDAMFDAAEECEFIDEGSVQMVDEDTFEFTVSGMHCMYDYRISSLKLSDEPTVASGKLVFEPKEGNTHTDLDILLVAPYYGYDPNFTQQHSSEAQILANYTGGTVTVLQGDAATAPAIAANYTEKAVVIYDSHGVANNESSYLCLTSPDGITTADYSSGRAINANGTACIDGRYIQNYASEELSNCMVWMAICEGMKLSGRGTTGSALLEAGAGVVLGFSQNVTFPGEYMYSEVFWQEMRYGRTVAEAFNAMTEQIGDHDYYGNAYPVVMSATDAFPANPDSHQTVTCDWTLAPISGEPDPTPAPTIDPSPDPDIPEGYVNVKLTVGQVWTDGSGYQMLLDADATAFGTIFEATGPLTPNGNAPEGLYDNFEYKIPEDADGVLTTSHIVGNDETVLITIPAGIYDWFIANPTPGDRIWGASSDGHYYGRYDDFEFESGKTYEFVIGRNEGFDSVSLFVDGVEIFPDPDPDLVVGWYFEMPADVAEWTFVDADGDGNDWRRNVDHAHEPAYQGHGCLVSASFINGTGALDPDNWAISPSFTVPSNNTVSLNWYSGPQDKYVAYAEHYGVYIGTGSDISTYELLYEETIDYPEYTKHTIDISAYAGQTVSIAFRHFDSFDVYELKIDVVEIRTGEIETDPTPTPTPEPNPNLLTGWNFESQEQVNEWTFVDADGDGYNWRKNVSAAMEPTFEGEGCLVSESYLNNGGRPLTPDNWAISPEFTIPAGMEAVLTWYIGAQSGSYHREKFGVYVGTGSDVSSYTELYVETPTYGDFTMRKVDLSAYAGQTISVAFRHFDSTDQLAIKLDLVQVFASADGNPLQLPAGFEICGYNMSDYGWVSFDSIDPREITRLYEDDGVNFTAAEYIDGVIYGFDLNGDLYSVDPETWIPTMIADCGDGSVSVLDLAHDRETGITYALIERTQGYFLAQVDLSSGMFTDLLSYGDIYLVPATLACMGNGRFVSVDIDQDVIYSYGIDGTLSKISDSDYAGGMGYQSMMYNPYDGMVYWSSRTWYGEYLFYQIDVANKVLNRVDYIGLPDGNNIDALFMLPVEIHELMGDVNSDGVVDTADVLLTIRHAIGCLSLSDEAFAAADTDGNGIVNIIDAVNIFRISMNLD